MKIIAVIDENSSNKVAPEINICRETQIQSVSDKKRNNPIKKCVGIPNPRSLQNLKFIKHAEASLRIKKSKLAVLNLFLLYKF